MTTGNQIANFGAVNVHEVGLEIATLLADMRPVIKHFP